MLVNVNLIMAEGFNEKLPSENGKNPSDAENTDDESTIPDLGVENIRSVDKKTQSNIEKGRSIYNRIKRNIYVCAYN